MAKSVKLGSDTYLDASGVAGIKGQLTGLDLNDYYFESQSGMYFVGSSATNCPSSYCAVLVVSSSNTMPVCIQLVMKQTTMYLRSYTGSPRAWSPWCLYTGTPVS